MVARACLAEETLAEDEVESQVIWYLNLLSEVVHAVPGSVLMTRRAQIDEIIAMGTRFRCKDAINAIGRFLQASARCNVYIVSAVLYDG